MFVVKAILWIFKLLLIFLLPFIALVRGAVFIHESYSLGPYISLVGGVCFSMVIAVIYMTWGFSKVTSRIGGIGAFKSRGIFALVLLLMFCIHGLFFISGQNLKNSNLSNEVRQLHPILRMAMSTWIIIDRDLVMTDASRQPEDYKKMGLPSKSHSLHFKQQDGYSYAMDLRTKNRSEFKNQLVRLYMRIMGLRTLRHGGTADHLHVSLFNHKKPYAI